MRGATGGGEVRRRWSELLHAWSVSPPQSYSGLNPDPRHQRGQNGPTRRGAVGFVHLYGQALCSLRPTALVAYGKCTRSHRAIQPCSARPTRPTRRRRTRRCLSNRHPPPRGHSRTASAMSGSCKTSRHTTSTSSPGVTHRPIASIIARTISRSGRRHEDLVAMVGELTDGTITSHLINWLSPLKERVTIATGERGCLLADTLRRGSDLLRERVRHDGMGSSRDLPRGHRRRHHPIGHRKEGTPAGRTRGISGRPARTARQRRHPMGGRAHGSGRGSRTRIREHRRGRRSRSRSATTSGRRNHGAGGLKRDAAILEVRTATVLACPNALCYPPCQTGKPRSYPAQQARRTRNDPVLPVATGGQRSVQASGRRRQTGTSGHRPTVAPEAPSPRTACGLREVQTPTPP
jgi:hypothetical protein